jgi:hypothetical protein
MRNLLVVRFALVLLAIGASVEAVAQKFQEPTKEELQMTSDPKAPGVPAVFLYLEQKTDNAGHYVSTYARIKVLTEAGKEWATVEVPYDPQMAAPPIIEARTIHPDGTIIPLTRKGADALTFQSIGPTLRRAYFTLPGVEVGSILEYWWTVPLTQGRLPFTIGDPYRPLYSSLYAKGTPTWEVQQTIPIRKASFYFNPFTLLEENDKSILNNNTYHTNLVDGERATNLLFTERLPASVHVAKSPKGEYFLQVEDVPALSNEVDAPNEASYRFQVVFYYSPYSFADVYWESEIKRWSKQLDHAAEATVDLKVIASQLAAGADSPEAKARKIYDYVQGLKNSGRTQTAQLAVGEQPDHLTPPFNAHEVLNARGGSSNDLAILYLGLARAAGLDVHGMKVASRDLQAFDPNYLSLSQVDALVVVLRIDGKDVFLDPGEALCPFGQLRWSHAFTGGIEEGAKAPSFTPANNTKDAVTAHTADLAVDAQGNVTGTVKVLMNGPEALQWRQLNRTADSDAVRERLSTFIRADLPTGLNAEVTSIQGLETSAGYVSVAAKVSGPLGKLSGKRISLPGFLFSTGTLPAFAVANHRESPVDLHYAGQTIDDVVYHVPAGYAVEGAPQTTQLPWPDHAVLVVKTQLGAGTIDIKHIFARAFVLLEAKEYPALRDYYQKAAATDQQQVVLTSAVSAGAN